MEKCYETIEVGDKNGENNEKWLEEKGERIKQEEKWKMRYHPRLNENEFSPWVAGQSLVSNYPRSCLVNSLRTDRASIGPAGGNLQPSFAPE